MSGAIDPMAMARFLVLPGAARLLEAFASIPPGPMRDAVIHLAETTAATYTGGGVARGPDPLHAIGGGAVSRVALTSRTGREPPTESRETQIVKLRIAGHDVDEIMEMTTSTRSSVYTAISKARRAGIEIPGRMPRRSEVRDEKTWHTDLESMSGQGRAATERAAAMRGITPQEYLDRRQVALTMAIQGAHYDDILEAIGETDSKVVSAWLSVARASGHNIPYLTHRAHDHRPQALEPVIDAEPEAAAPAGRVFPEFASLTRGAAHAVEQAAQRRNMTVQSYQDLRESMVRHRLDGKTIPEISTMTGETKQVVKDTLDSARDKGVTFPPFAAEDDPGVIVELASSAERNTG